MLSNFNVLILIMSILAIIIFIALFFTTAGYGRFYNKKWGKAISNKLGWFLMEFPVFIAMLMIWLLSDRTNDVIRLVFFILFQIHYLQRSFIFPFLVRGKSQMAISVVFMGIVFNLINAWMQGGWIFYNSPIDYYPITWFKTPQFIIGTIIFFTGMIINLHSDNVIRNLRKKNDTKHYLPTKGLFKYVTSANYFGELVEWTGFAILTWSLSGAVFVLWTFANLAPRASKIHKNYKIEFHEQLEGSKVKRLIPFIY